MKKRSHTRRFGVGTRISHDAASYYHSKLYAGIPAPGEAEAASLENPLPSGLENRILTANAEDMSFLPDNSVHLLVTSPPYNASKDYDADMSLQDYLGLLEKVFSEAYRVLVDGGRACINVANLGRRPYIPLSAHLSQLMIKIGFQMRGEIIWNKGAAAGISMAWGSWRSASNPVLRDVHEYILVFSKGSFRRLKTEQHENTITREEFMEWTKSVWTIHPESARKVGHPAPFPVELPYRLIQLFTYKGDVVLDPFMGSGSTALAALQAGRRFVGCEINPEYVKLAEQRIAEFQSLPDGVE